MTLLQSIRPTEVVKNAGESKQGQERQHRIIEIALLPWKTDCHNKIINLFVFFSSPRSIRCKSFGTYRLQDWPRWISNYYRPRSPCTLSLYHGQQVSENALWNVLNLVLLSFGGLERSTRTGQQKLQPCVTVSLNSFILGVHLQHPMAVEGSSSSIRAKCVCRRCCVDRKLSSLWA